MANPTTKKGNGPKAIRILLVEDNPGDVYLLEKTLQTRKLPYELIRYIDGRAGDPCDSVGIGRGSRSIGLVVEHTLLVAIRR
jgi:hypothetical protein